MAKLSSPQASALSLDFSLLAIQETGMWGYGTRTYQELMFGLLTETILFQTPLEPSKSSIKALLYLI
jgi:hypothetical protein